jgi:hypothetical protein
MYVRSYSYFTRHVSVGCRADHKVLAYRKSDKRSRIRGIAIRERSKQKGESYFSFVFTARYQLLKDPITNTTDFRPAPSTFKHKSTQIYRRPSLNHITKTNNKHAHHHRSLHLHTPQHRHLALRSHQPPQHHAPRPREPGLRPRADRTIDLLLHGFQQNLPARRRPATAERQTGVLQA